MRVQLLAMGGEPFDLGIKRDACRIGGVDIARAPADRALSLSA
jgi:hypothetical protein